MGRLSTQRRRTRVALAAATTLATVAAILGVAVGPGAAPSQAFPEDTAYVVNLNTARLYTQPVGGPFNSGTTYLGTQVGPTASLLRGIDFDPTATTLYGISAATNEFGTVNLTTGAFTPSFSLPAPPGTLTYTDLAIDPVSGVMFASTGNPDDNTEGKLFSIDPVAQTISEIATLSGVNIVDMAVDCNGNLYGEDSVSDALFRINRTTAAATMVGFTFGYDIGPYSQGMDFDNSDGTLYAWQYAQGSIMQYVKLNLTTGQYQQVGGGGGAITTPGAQFEGAIKTTCGNAPRSISISDISVTETDAGSPHATITVTATPATGNAVPFGFQTVDGTATAGADYDAVSGGAVIAPSSSTATFTVPIVGDGAPEGIETFGMKLSLGPSAVNTISKDTGVVTINDNDGGPPPPLIIQAFRFAGPAGADDDYVEIYNPTGAMVPLGGWTLQVSDGTNVALPAVNLPGGRNYLVGGSGYSLFNVAQADLSPPGLNLPAAGGVRLVSPQGPATDAVGMSTAGPAFREGTGLLAPTSSGGQHGFERRIAFGVPVDSNVNNTDIALIAIDADTNSRGVNPWLGSPMPHSLASLRTNNNGGYATLLDPSVGAAQAPNRVVSGSTMTIRRRLTNNTGAGVNTMQVRITILTTYGSAASNQAILTAKNSAAETVAVTGGQQVQVKGLTLQPPAAAAGGVYALLDVPLSTVLAPGESVPIALSFNIVRGGSFVVGWNVETN